MIIDGPGSNHLMIMFDRRTDVDVQVGGVMRRSGFGRAALGETEWKKTIRVSILDYKQEPHKAKEMGAVRQSINSIINSHSINTVVVLQSSQFADVRTTNLAWNVFKPGSPYNWAGTVLPINGVNVCPVLNPYNADWAYNWLIRRQLIQAHSLATGTLRCREWPTLITVPGPSMTSELERLLKAPYVAIDIETDTKKSIISCIGISDGRGAVSVPWDDFVVAGTDRWEVGAAASTKDLVRQLLASGSTKIGHNFTFDVYNLGQHGIEVRGPLEDTLLMSHSIFPQFRKGLQQCAAMCFAIEPWKSLHKPPTMKDGDKWLATPEATRLYNAKDATATVWIYEKFLEWMI